MVGYKNKKGAGTGKRKVHIFSNSHRIKSIYTGSQIFTQSNLFISGTEGCWWLPKASGLDAFAKRHLNKSLVWVYIYMFEAVWIRVILKWTQTCAPNFVFLKSLKIYGVQ